MCSLRKSLFTGLLFVVVFQLNGQAEKRSYAFKKGQVFDIIFLSTKPEASELLKGYFKEIFPIAEQAGYNPLKGFSIKEDPTQGNYHPQAMIFGYWNDFGAREKFLEEVVQKTPDFHKQRRAIWSTFDLTYYELEKDLAFEVDPEKFNVVTAYWQNNEKTFKKFKKEWLAKTQKAGGEVLLTLVDGKSPFGYHFNPDYLVLTEWASKTAFEAFYQENLQMNHQSVEHVNQFIIQ